MLNSKIFTVVVINVTTDKHVASIYACDTHTHLKVVYEVMNHSHMRNELTIYKPIKHVSCCGIVSLPWWAVTLVLLVLGLLLSITTTTIFATWYHNFDHSQCAATSQFSVKIVLPNGITRLSPWFPPPFPPPSPPPSPLPSPPPSPPLSAPPFPPPRECCKCFEEASDQCEATTNCQGTAEEKCAIRFQCNQRHFNVDVYVPYDPYCIQDDTGVMGNEAVCTDLCRGELKCKMDENGCIYPCCIKSDPNLPFAWWGTECRR